MPDPITDIPRKEINLVASGLLVVALIIASCSPLNSPTPNGPETQIANQMGTLAALEATATEIAKMGATIQAHQTEITNNQATSTQIAAAFETPWVIARQETVTALSTATPELIAPEAKQALELLEAATFKVSVQISASELDTSSGSTATLTKLTPDYAEFMLASHAITSNPNLAGLPHSEVINHIQHLGLVVSPQIGDNPSELSSIQSSEGIQIYLDPLKDVAFIRVPANHPNLPLLDQSMVVPVYSGDPLPTSATAAWYSMGFPADTWGFLSEGEFSQYSKDQLFLDSKNPNVIVFLGATSNAGGSGQPLITSIDGMFQAIGCLHGSQNNFVEYHRPTPPTDDQFANINP